MRKAVIRGRYSLSVLLAGVLIPLVALAEPVAVVNGTSIQSGQLHEELKSLPLIVRVQQEETALRRLIVDATIDKVLLAEAAMASGVAESDFYKEMLDTYAQDLAVQLYIDQRTREVVSAARIKALYNELYPADKPYIQWRIRQILVPDETLAQQIAAQLQAGADFATLAQTHSLSPSKISGGLIDWQHEEQMLPEVAEQVIQLQEGEMSAPFATVFGWQIIRLEAQRTGQRPALADVEQALMHHLFREARQAIITELRKNAEITVNDAALAAVPLQ